MFFYRHSMCEREGAAPSLFLIAYISRLKLNQYQHHSRSLSRSLSLNNPPSADFVLHPSLSDAQTGVVTVVSPRYRATTARRTV